MVGVFIGAVSPCACHGTSLSVWQRVDEPSALNALSPAAGTSSLATSSFPAAVTSLRCVLPAVGRMSPDRQFGRCNNNTI